MYTGLECRHCKSMDPLIDKLEKEEKIKIKKVETWHNTKNKKLLEKADNGKCGGVPFFYNKKTKKFICGSTSYSKLKSWALNK
jgi:hypothetical protein